MAETLTETLTLEGDGGDLLLDVAVNNLGWSRCYLLGDKKIYLGGETADRLLPRLQEVVQEGARDGHPVGELCNIPVRCALILSEAHHALYFADDGADRLLFWQNADADPVTLAGTMRLSPEQRRQWQDQLTAALHKYFLNRARQAAITKEIAEIVGGAEALK